MSNRALVIATAAVVVVVALALTLAADAQQRTAQLEQRIISDAYIVTSAQETATVRALFTTRTPEPGVSR